MKRVWIYLLIICMLLAAKYLDVFGLFRPAENDPARAPERPRRPPAAEAAQPATPAAMAAPEETPLPRAQVRIDDAAMIAATAEAKRTLAAFIAKLETAEETTYCAVKVELDDEDGDTERLWLKGVTYSEKIFSGILGEAPRRLNEYRKGQVVGVYADNVVDWMVVENGRLVGGYTIRAYRQNLSPQARKVFDKRVLFRFD